VIRSSGGSKCAQRSSNVIMGVLPDVRGLNATDVFENTKILIELEKRAPQCKRSEGDPSPRHHINWPRTEPSTGIRRPLRRGGERRRFARTLTVEHGVADRWHA
jgi:hypothetical protein